MSRLRSRQLLCPDELRESYGASLWNFSPSGPNITETRDRTVAAKFRRGPRTIETEEPLRKILVYNPRRSLAFVPKT